jgi:hypothetical protein
MKQTAVDWLQQALEDTILDHEQIMQTVGLFEQAKEMEKEQMIDFAKEVFNNRYNQIHNSLGSIADDIYNETFNTNEK